MPLDGRVEDFETEVQDEVVTTLRRAAQYIRDHGWCQRNLSTPDGRACLRGAMIAVVGMEVPLHWPTIERQQIAPLVEADRQVAAYLARTHGFVTTTYQNAATWNNAPERTASEVIEALEGAARARALSLRVGK